MRRCAGITTLLVFFLPLVSATSCPAITWIDGVEVHDVSGVVDMMNDNATRSPQECSALCCATEGCVAFVYKTAQSPPAGNCTTDGGRCCWLKPTLNTSRLNETSEGCTSGYLQDIPPEPPAVPTVSLQSPGVEMPLVSLGTGSGMIQKGDVCEAATSLWLSGGVGGTAIDTALVYNDQMNVSRGIAKVQPPLAREEYFITSKCPPSSYVEAQRCVRENLQQLGTGYVDLLLVHWPSEADGAAGRAETLATWQAVQESWRNGTARAIGVSSFLQADLELVINEAGAPLVSTGTDKDKRSCVHI